MPLLDLYADKIDDNTWQGRVRVAESTDNGYVFSRHVAQTKRTIQADALNDARLLALDIATENNMRVIHERKRTLVIK